MPPPEATQGAGVPRLPADAELRSQAATGARSQVADAPRPPKTALGEFFSYAIVRLVVGYVLVFWVARWLTRALYDPLYALFDRLAGLSGGSYVNLGYPRLPETVALIVVPTVIYWVFVRLSERRRVRELGGGWRGLLEGGAGLLLGAGLFAAVIGVLALAGAYDVIGGQTWTVLQWSLPVAAVAFREELVFRGIVLRVGEERLGSWLALALSSAWFGLLHADNPNADVVDGLMIALFGGLLLGAAYLCTRRLWLAIGVHAAWNFVQGGIFGAPVSGYEIPGVLQARLSGPDWLDGGPFGPESSLVALAVCGAASVVLLLLARRRGHLRPPRLRRRPPEPLPPLPTSLRAS
jgi:membrane protease YdiL (CAAX protease family)